MLLALCMQAWRSVIDLPRFQMTRGRDFIFYDGHPGFVKGVFKSHPATALDAASDFAEPQGRSLLIRTVGISS